MTHLKDKIVLVTGAAGAIGGTICAVIEQAGGMVIATDLAKGQGIVHALDVTSEASWRGVIAEVERDHGRLDGLVNAAGVVALGTVEELDFATWRRVLSINLDGTFLGCKYAMPLLRKKGGAIVNLSSGFFVVLAMSSTIGPSMKAGQIALQRTGGFSRAP